MGGHECIELLLDLDANINAIVASGYSNDPIMGNFEDYGFKGVLIKPFTLDQLKSVVSNIER
jgi:hypothetical protein